MSDEEMLAGLRGPPPPRYQLVRFVFLRLFGLVQSMAFLGLALQLDGLIGSRGILPVHEHLARMRASHGGALGAFLERPTLFQLGGSDAALHAAAWLGFAMSVAVALGMTNAIWMAALWVLYLSFVHVGQIFWGYGWEILILEAGFLAIFLCPLRSIHPLPVERAPAMVIWLYRWLAFRVMFGAGLIKIRGDECWRDLTCLATHYETQPLPNPLSLHLHHAPLWLHQSGVLFNHAVELAVPFLLLVPWRRLRWPAALLTIGFQGILIMSGNLSFLNWLTIAVTIPALDDAFLARLFPRSLRGRDLAEPSRPRRGAIWALAAVVLFLSVDPLVNMLSPDQVMNTSFDRLHLVNTYGAFGSVNRRRYEVILEGTLDDPGDPQARWRAWELPCKPGDPERAPCVAAPYHYRLDWQLWFAAMRDYDHEPWIVRLVDRLLDGEPAVRGLFANDPFPDGPPRWVRAELYRYRFVASGERGWWRRELVGEYLRPLSKDDPELQAFLRAYGWR